MSRIPSINLDVVKRPRILIVIGIVLVVLIAWYLAWWSPEGTKLASVQAQQTQETQQKASLQGQLVQILHENAIVRKDQSFLTFFGSEVPVQPQQGEIVQLIFRLSQSDNVDIANLNDSVTAPPLAGGTLSTVPISFSLSGPHRSVVKFLTDLYTLPRLITIQSISPAPSPPPQGLYDVLKSDSVPFTLTLSATAYFSGQVGAGT